MTTRRRAHPLIREAFRRNISLLDRLLAATLGAPSGDPDRFPAVFIVGGPRSGSTLFYQLAVATYRVAYISNLIARFPRSAPRIAQTLLLRSWPRPARFESTYGDTPGILGPSEAGDLWDWIFPYDTSHSVAPEAVTEEQKTRLRATVGGLAAAYDAPFVAKNLWNSVRVEAIASILPKSLFVVLHRDPLLMAASLLESRRRRIGDAPGFFSIVPDELLPFSHEAPARQVARQLAFTYRAIQSARCRLGSGRFMDVRYEDLCARPATVLTGFRDFLAAHGADIEQVGLPPANFSPSVHAAITPRDRLAIESVLREMWPGATR